MAKHPFRSIGQRVRDFARAHIRSYVPSGELVSRSELPPSWQTDGDEPLVWRDDAPATPAMGAPAPAESDWEATDDTPASRDFAPTPPVVTHNMLERLMAAHEERMASEETAPPSISQPISQPTAQPAPVQRQVEAPASAADASETEALPRIVTKRRRGAVVDVPSQTTPSTGEEDTPPDFFFLNDAAPDSPAVQRAPANPPAPQTPSEPSKPSSPAAPFWRRLFSRGDEPEPQVEDSSSDSTPLSSEITGDQPFSPAESSSLASSGTPAVQRAPEDAPTILTPDETPYSPAAPPAPSAPDSLPASPTPTTRRRSSGRTVQRSAAPEASPPPSDPLSSSTTQPTAPAPPVQRQTDATTPAASRQPTSASTPAAPLGGEYPSMPSSEGFESHDISPSAAFEPSEGAPPRSPVIQRRADTSVPSVPSVPTAPSAPSAPTRRPRAGRENPPAQRQTDAAPASSPVQPPAPETVVPAHDAPASPPSSVPAPTPSQSGESRVQRRAEPPAEQSDAPVNPAPPVSAAPGAPRENPPTPAITGQPTSASTPAVQRQSAGNDDFPIVPLRETPVTAVQREIDPEAVSDQPDSHVEQPTPPAQASQVPPAPAQPSSPASTQRGAPAVQRQSNPAGSTPPDQSFSPSQPPAPTSADQPAQDSHVFSPAAPDAPDLTTPSVIQRKSGSKPPARRIQRRANTPPAVEPPAEPDASTPETDTSAPIQPTLNAPPPYDRPVESGMADVPTLLTPAPQTPGVQRRTSQTEPSGGAFEREPDSYRPDAPTILTPSVPPASSPVQRQSSGEPAPEFQSQHIEREPRHPDAPPSPWSAFIEPPTTAAETPDDANMARPTVTEVPPSQAQPSLQRAAQPPESPSFRPSEPEQPPLSEQPVDLFTAMMDAGMVTSRQPQQSAPPVTRRSAPDAIRRSSQPSSQPSTQQSSPPSGDSALPASTGMQPPAPEGDSTDADLLSLIDLPPTTPVIRESPSSPVVSRARRPAAEQHDHSQQADTPAEPPHIETFTDDWGSIMRADTTDTIEDAEPTTPVAEGEETPQEDVSVDKLARDVLDVLRQRLRVEQERRGGRP